VLCSYPTIVQRKEEKRWAEQLLAQVDKSTVKQAALCSWDRRCRDAVVNASSDKKICLQERQKKGGHSRNGYGNARRTNKCRLADSKYTLLATEAGPDNAGRYVTIEISFLCHYVVMVVLVDA